MGATVKFFLRLLFHMRWAYFHIHPGYVKIIVDEASQEAHFFHAKTNSLHCNYTIK